MELQNLFMKLIPVALAFEKNHSKASQSTSFSYISGYILVAFYV